jgi:hypothetical protein
MHLPAHQYLDDHAMLYQTTPATYSCGERAGQQVRRIGSGCGDDGEWPPLRLGSAATDDAQPAARRADTRGEAVAV